MKLLLVLLISIVGVSIAGPASLPKTVSTNECPAKGTHFLPNKSDCSYYFICYNGVYSLRQCAAGLIFDMLSTNCNYPEQSVCITEVQPSQPIPPYVPPRPTQSPGRENPGGKTAGTPSGVILDFKTAGTPRGPPMDW